MELTHDWRTFQSVFYSKKRLSSQPSSHVIHVVTEGAKILSVMTEKQDLQAWVGSSVDDFVSHFKDHEILTYSRETMDQALLEGSHLSHYYDQLQWLRSECPPKIFHRHKRSTEGSLHFLLEAIQSWWRKVLPSRYGIYVQLDGDSDPLGIFLTIQGGRMSAFHTADLSSLMSNQKKQPSLVVRHLTEHYLMPVQGFFVTKEDWLKWSELSDPWPSILTSLKANRAQMVPFKWSFASLIAARSSLGI